MLTAVMRMYRKELHVFHKMASKFVQEVAPALEYFPAAQGSHVACSGSVDMTLLNEPAGQCSVKEGNDTNKPRAPPVFSTVKLMEEEGDMLVNVKTPR